MKLKEILNHENLTAEGAVSLVGSLVTQTAKVNEDGELCIVYGRLTQYAPVEEVTGESLVEYIETLNEGDLSMDEFAGDEYTGEELFNDLLRVFTTVQKMR